MIKHKVGETRAERKIRMIIEHNKKVITEYYHLDYEKVLKKNAKEFGENIRRIKSTFSDMEMENALILGIVIGRAQEPEDGFTYEEIANGLLGYKIEAKRNEELEDGKEEEYRSKINRLLYVLQYMSFDFLYNTTIEREEKGERSLSMFPCIRLTHKVREEDDGKIITYDEPVEMIFNGCKSKYASEELLKFGLHKIPLPKRDISL
jgi:hypothetical protein